MIGKRYKTISWTIIRGGKSWKTYSYFSKWYEQRDLAVNHSQASGLTSPPPPILSLTWSTAKKQPELYNSFAIILQRKKNLIRKQKQMKKQNQNISQVN